MSIYYEGSKYFYIGHPDIHLYMCNGIRGRGKTTTYIGQSTKRAVDDILDNEGKGNHKFVYLRRKQEQLDLAIQTGLYNNVLSVPKYRDMLRGFTNNRVWQNQIILSNSEGAQISVGYTKTLNNVKGISIEDADCLLFDEYVEPSRGDYKGGDGGIHEPELLARLDETLFRNRENWFVLLGNDDQPTNPYNEYFGIPFGAKKYTIKEKQLLFEFDYDEDFVKYKKNTSTGKRWSGSEYSDYSNGVKSLGQVDDGLILEKPKHAYHYANFIIVGNNITCWYDDIDCMYYFHDNYKFDKTKCIYSVLSKDMKVDTLFLSFNSDVMMKFKILYGRGRLRFNNQKTASLFQVMMSLNK